MRYDCVFFDLDGTLTDSAPGIMNSIRYAVKKYGRGIDAGDLRRFIGPPLAWAFSTFCHVSEEDGKLLLGYYREYYPVKGIYESRVYEGVEELLKYLCGKGICCVLATCKPRVYAEKILEHFGLRPYFSYVSGPEFDGTRGEKNEVIEYAIKEMKIADKGRVLMVGDRENDAIGARLAGVECVGALWGFGTDEELTNAGTKRNFASPAELKAYFAEDEMKSPSPVR